MNILFLITTLFLSVNCYPQEKLIDIFPINDGNILYTDVIQVDSTAKDELYNRAKRWVIDTFKSGKDVIQLDDKENGEIICRGFFTTPGWGNEKTAKYYVMPDVKVWFTIKIQIKDNKFKYDMYDYLLDIYLPGAGGLPTTNTEINLKEWIDGWDQMIIEKPKMAQKALDSSEIRIFLMSIDSKVKIQISSLIIAMKTKRNDNW